jgi:hypothetical protein
VICDQAQCAAFLLEKGEIHEKAAEEEFKKAFKEDPEKNGSESIEDSSDEIIEKTFK